MVTRDRLAPQVAAVDVILVRGENQLAAIGTEGNELHFEIAGREELCRAARNGNRIKMSPAVALPGKHQVIAGAPEDLMLGHNLAKDAAATGIGAPNFLPLTGGSVGHADRPRLACAFRPEDKVVA